MRLKMKSNPYDRMEARLFDKDKFQHLVFYACVWFLIVLSVVSVVSELFFSVSWDYIQAWSVGLPASVFIVWSVRKNLSEVALDVAGDYRRERAELMERIKGLEEALERR